MLKFVATLSAGMFLGMFLPRKKLILAIQALGAKLEVEGAIMQGKTPTED